ncbi:hypothetical protein [Paenibacillus harenae]|uniref:Uncharacterized protein n=1 Tax=Paenibacillus harenae TaxID=306543 RepID=A0ABT9U5U1_PAEHA|nr:hypothetical protein [Paenibacillus harenae]MDQ0115012.1 hypothetical protein [Paenibacillus harenae]
MATDKPPRILIGSPVRQTPDILAICSDGSLSVKRNRHMFGCQCHHWRTGIWRFFYRWHVLAPRIMPASVRGLLQLGDIRNHSG